MILLPLIFNCRVDQFCCGHIQLGNFSEGSPIVYRNRNITEKPLLSSKEEVFTDFENRVKEWMRRYLGEEEESYGTFGLSLTLIEHQLPEFHTYLKSSGWDQISSWRNQRTENIICLYHKVLSDDYVESIIEENW